MAKDQITTQVESDLRAAASGWRYHALVRSHKGTVLSVHVLDAGHRHYRPSLDGLRAIAVTAVVIFHLDIPYLPGGYLGVDLFFVLSGYLITELLIREYSTTGTISLRDFWARRARRLLPALVVVLLAVAGYSYANADPEQLYWLRREGLAALFYAANWWFISSGTSYFADSSAESPLLHTWSLAIEEQFYIVWPLLLLLLLRVRKNLVIPVTFMIVAASLSSIQMALLADAGGSRAYFGTDSRVFQLFIGGLAAVLVRRLASGRVGGARGRLWMPLSVVSAFVVAFFMANLNEGSMNYYRGGALIFSLAVAALLVSLDMRASIVGRLLAWRPAVYVGRISYGVYLWHWPVIIFFPYLYLFTDGRLGRVFSMAAQVGLTLALSALSFHVIEKPIRSGALAGWRLTPRRTLAGVTLAFAMTAGSITAATAAEELPHWATKVPSGQLQVLGDTSPSAPTVAIVGDSIARSMLPGLNSAAQKAGVRIIGAAWAGCGVGVEYLLGPDGRTPFNYSESCDKALPQAFARMVKKYDPDVVMWHSVIERHPFRRADGSVVVPGTAQYEAAVRENFTKSYRALTSGGAPLLIAEIVPKGQRFKGACKREPSREECRPDTRSDTLYPSMNQRLRQFAASVANARTINIASIICPGGAPCPTYVNGVMVRYDGSHLTLGGSQLTAGPILRLILDTAGIKIPRPEALPKRTLRPTAGKSQP